MESQEWIERGVDEDALVSLCIYICGTCLSQCVAPLGEDMLTGSTCVNGSATLESGAVHSSPVMCPWVKSLLLG